MSELIRQHSIAGVMTEDLGSRRAWRSVFLLTIFTTAVADCLTVANLLSNWKALATKIPGQRPLHPRKDKLLQVLARLDFFSFISGSIAFISLQFALYLGTTQGWNSLGVISLLTTGFGVSSTLFIFQQSQKHFTAETLPAIIPMRGLSLRQVVHAICIASWGFSFYSFSFFTREFYCYSGREMADHL
jgi:MFS family permease